MKSRIVAITGMPGARKSDAAKIFREFGCQIFNMSSIIREEILKINEIPNPSNYHRIGVKLRKQYGPAIIAKRTLSRIPNEGLFCVIDGIRSVEEVEFFRNNSDYFRTVCVHAARSVRFSRMRERSGPELDTQEDLVHQDYNDLCLGLGRVIALSDFMIINGNYTSSPFEEEVKKVYCLIAEEIHNRSIDKKSKFGICRK